MNGFYNITDSIKDYLEAHNSINTVKLGNISEVDLAKQTIYPLGHIIVGDVAFQDGTSTFDVTVLCMDSVVQSQDDPSLVEDSFMGIDNKQDVYNTMLAVVNGLQKTLKDGNLYQSNYHLEGEPTASPFEDNFGNLLTGWSLDFTVIMPNINITDCDFRVPSPCKLTWDNNSITWDAL